MTDSRHDRWSEDLAAYLLGALEPERASALERHAEGCDFCRAELRWLSPAAGVLPETVERLEPPPELRQRLFAEVRADTASGGAREAGGLRRLGIRLHRRRRGSVGWRPLAALAAMALVAAAIAGYEIGNSSGGPAGSAATTFHSGQAPGVVAEVRRQGTNGKLRLAHVHPLPDGRVLEAWVRRKGAVEPVKGLFAPDRSGEASTTLGDMTGVDLVMVTVEPAGGTQAPTTAPITSVRIQ
jgi:anti-sigma-K factor RskA